MGHILHFDKVQVVDFYRDAFGITTKNSLPSQHYKDFLQQFSCRICLFVSLTFLFMIHLSPWLSMVWGKALHGASCMWIYNPPHATTEKKRLSSPLWLLLIDEFYQSLMKLSASGLSILFHWSTKLILKSMLCSVFYLGAGIKF